MSVLGLVPTHVWCQPSRVENPYGQTVEFTVTLRERNALIGEVPLQISKEGDLSVDLTALTTALSRRITAGASQALLQLPTTEGRVDFQSLASLGYGLTYSESALELVISIPLSARPVGNYSVMGASREEVGDFDSPAAFSFAANVRLNGDFSHSAFGDEAAVGGTITLLGRMGKVAYQSNLRVPSNRSDLFHEGSRLIYDDIDRALRWQFGDVRPFSSSPVGGEDVLGFGVSRETDVLQPERLVRVRGAQTFSIEEPSDVTVSVNGRVITRRTFAPGNYNIADFPFVRGRNEIKLAILNQAGEQEELTFNQFIDSRLLESGRDDFGLAFGISSQAGYTRSRQYDAQNLVLNAHYIKGISENLTLGIATALNSRRQVVLATGVRANVWGVTSGRLGISAQSGGQTFGTIGVAVVRTLNSFESNETSRTFRLALDSRIDVDDPRKSTYNASFGYAWPISPRLNASTELRISDQNYSAGLQTSFVLTRNVRVDLSLDWRSDNQNDAGGTSFAITLSRSFGSGGQARAYYDSSLGEARLALSRAQDGGLGAWSHSGEVASTGEESALTTAHTALFNRFDVSVGTGANWRGKNNSQRLGISFGTAIAFADKSVAWGRPVTDSFAIVSGHPSLDGRTISLDSRSLKSGTMARSSRWSPALVSALGTYAPRVVSVTVADPPIGYDVGSGTYRVSPPLFAGYRFVVGSDTASTVIGTLRLLDGKPASLVAGVATSEDWPDVEPITVFTNATGQFSVTGLGRGRWSLKMRGVSGRFDFTIANNATSLIELGNVDVTDSDGP